MSNFEKLVLRSLWVILKWIINKSLSEVDIGYARETTVKISKFYQEEMNGGTDGDR